MERYLITIFDLDDATFHLLDQEQYDELGLVMNLGEHFYLEHCPGTAFATAGDLVKYCVRHNVKVVKEEMALLPQ